MKKLLIKFTIFTFAIAPMLMINVYGQNTSKHDLKAAFVANFIKNITWKDEANLKVFTIGVYSPDSSEVAALKSITTAKGKPVKIIQFYTPSEFKDVQVFYVNELYNADMFIIRKFLSNKNTLLITENNDFEKSMINFIVDKNYLRYEINESNLSKAQLEANPRLFTMAKTNTEFKDLYLKTEKLLESEKLTVAQQKQELEKLKEEFEKQKQIIEKQKQEIHQQKDSIIVQAEKLKLQQEKYEKINADILMQQLTLVEKNKILTLQEQKLKIQEENIKKADTEIRRRMSELEEISEILQQQRAEKRLQEAQIEAQKEILREYDRKYATQKVLLTLAVAFSILVLILIIVVFRNYNAKKKAHQILHEKNLAISQQNEEIQRQNEEISQHLESLASLHENLKLKNEEIMQQKLALENANKELAIKNSALEKLSIVASETDNSVIIYSANGAFEWANEGFVKLYGYTHDEIIKHSPNDFVVASCHPDAQKIFNTCKKNKKSISFDYEITDKYGNVKWVQNTLTPILDENNNIIRFVAIESDVTRLKLVEQELENLNRTLEARIQEEVNNSRKKDHMLTQQSRQAAMGEMIGNIAHQWRQPLNAVGVIIQNFIEAYEYGDLNEEYIKQKTAKAMELIQYMSRTIDDFRNFFRPEKQKQLFNASEMLYKAISFMEASLKNMNIDIQLEVQEDVFINGYANEYAQVIINIINNAKDALVERKPKQPKISILLTKQAEKSVLSITDNGGGIPTQIMDKIFEPYYSTKDASKGTGLGLYMSKTIIEKNMEGSLTVRNTKDGACFTITI